MAGQRSRNLQWADVEAWLESQWIIGADVSANRIVDALGGSTATAQRFLERWRTEKRTAAKQYPMPPELVAKQLILMSQAFQGLKGQADEQLRANQAEWQQREAAWTRELADLTSELDAKAHALDRSEQQLQATKDSVTRLQRELEQRDSDIATLKDTMVSLNNTIKIQKQRTQDALEAASRDEDRLMVQLDMERTEKRQAKQDLVKGLEALRKEAATQLNDNAQRLESMRIEHEEARQQLATAQATAEAGKKYIAHIEQQNALLQEQLDQHNRLTQKSIDDSTEKVKEECQGRLEELLARVEEQKQHIATLTSLLVQAPKEKSSVKK